MIESLQQQLLANKKVLLALHCGVKNLSQKNVTCDAICGISDFLQNIDSSSARSNWYDTNINDVHVSPSCYKTQNNDLSDIFEGKNHIEDDDFGNR